MTTSSPREGLPFIKGHLRHDLLPMRLYHKAKTLGIWNPRDIDLTRDKEDWQRLSEVYTKSLRQFLLNFEDGEEAVTLHLLPLQLTIAREGRLEEELFLSTFLWEEAKHTEFFCRVLDELPPNWGEQQEQDTRSPWHPLWREELPAAMNRLLTDPSPQNQLKACIVYHIILEGLLAQISFANFFLLMKHINCLPGLQTGMRLVQRDEGRHVAYGIFLISRLVAQEKSLWPLVEEEMQRYFAFIEGQQIKEGTPEWMRAATGRLFEKRLSQLGRARSQSVIQVYQAAPSEETAEEGR